jgi:aminoglycoside phosphotransferase (APT) family kinase protein
MTSTPPSRLDDKEGWSRAKASEALPLDVVQRLVARAFPRHRLASAELLAGGLSNSNFKLRLDPDTDPIVLRIYDRDPAACQKEVDLLALVRPTVPVPEVVHAEPGGMDGVGPFVLMRYVDGVTFRQLKAAGDVRALEEACYSIGNASAAIAQYRFPRGGWLMAGPAVGQPLAEGPDPIPRFIDECLASPNLSKRMSEPLVQSLHSFSWSWAPRLAPLDVERSLVHGDFNSPNLLLRRQEGRWCVAAVLDWEFAVSGSPLVDVGNFLRYERTRRPLREPHFSRGFVDGGGTLPDGWMRLARVLDLTSLCEILTRETLPDDVVSEVIGLIGATIEDRDPD